MRKICKFCKKGINNCHKNKLYHEKCSLLFLKGYSQEYHIKNKDNPEYIKKRKEVEKRKVKEMRRYKKSILKNTFKLSQKILKNDKLKVEPKVNYKKFIGGKKVLMRPCAFCKKPLIMKQLNHRFHKKCKLLQDKEYNQRPEVKIRKRIKRFLKK